MTTKKATRKKTNRGRPHKLTKELQNKLVKLVSEGHYIETSVAFVGLSKDTFYSWLKRGAREKERVAKNPNSKIKQSELPFVELSDAIEKAKAQAEINDLNNIKKASALDWKASAWRLERKFPDRWGRKERMDMDIKSQHTDKKEVHIHQQLEDDPESKELLKQLFRRQVTLGENGGKFQ